MTGDARRIVLATSNPGKCREIRQVLSGLDVEVASLAEFPPIPPVAEDGATFADNARKKALYYAQATGCWALADDSGLAVDALDGLPGVTSARFAGEDLPADANRPAIDAANNAKLLRLLQDVPQQQRSARFICHLSLAEPGKVLLETHGTVEGRIGASQKGSNGFGYDPLFIVEGMARTAAELSADAKNLVSHRGKAVREFARMLAEIL